MTNGLKKTIGCIIALSVLAIMPTVCKGSGYFLHLLFLIAIKAVWSTSWNIMSGYSGQLSLGHGVFIGLGAYAATILTLKAGTNPWISMLTSGLITGTIGVIIGCCLFRLRGAFFALSTTVLSKIAQLLIIYFKDFTNGPIGLNLPMDKEGVAYIYFVNKQGYVYIAFFLLVITLLVAWKIKNSKLGLQLFALRDDHDAASSLGINTMLAKLCSMFVSCFLIALAASVYAHYTLYIDPTSIFDPQLGLDMTIMANLGGRGTMFGPLFGTIILVPIDTVLRSIIGGGSLAGMDIIIYGVLLIVIVQFCPQGLVPLFQDLIRKFLVKRGFIKEKTEAVNALSNKAVIDTNKLKEVIRNDVSDFNGPILRVEDLSVSFSGLKAVNKVSFQVEQGELFGIIGPNGAGKTTVFNAITGFFKPSSGTVYYMGQKLSNGIRPYQLSRIGLTRTFQSVKPFLGMTVEESIMAGIMLHNGDYAEARVKANELLDMVGLKYAAKLSPKGLTVAEQKRLDLVRALATSPRILMLDEPMAGLTENEVQDLIEVIRSLSRCGITIIIIEHVMHAVMNLCDRVIVLDHGEKIDDGKPETVVNNPKVINIYLGEQINE